MIIYLASGFSVMNVPGREEELCAKMLANGYDYNRLVSYYDTIVGNNIQAVLDLKMKGVKK